MTSITNTMEGMIEAGIKSLEQSKMDVVPKELYQYSFGIVLLEAVQVGFLISAGAGTGILLRHDKEHQTWSPPCAIGLTNVGAGFSFGIEQKHMIIFLTEKEMVDAMASDFSFRLGAQSSIALGPIGEEMDFTAHIGTKGAGTTAGLTKTSGLYAGVEMDGAALAPRPAINEKFYGQSMTPRKILFGEMEVAVECEPLERLHQKLQELAKKPTSSPAYVETIASPFHKTNKKTNMMET